MSDINSHDVLGSLTRPRRATLAKALFAVTLASASTVSLQAAAQATIRSGNGEVTPHSHPWIASLRDGNDQHFCVASLVRVSPTINESDILVTTADCLYEGPWMPEAVLGGHDLLQSSAGQVSAAVTYWVLHPNYDPQTVENNIAVLKIASPVPFTATIQPARLPNQGAVIAAGKAGVTGGWNASATPAPNHLLQLHSTVMGNTKCVNANTAVGWTVNTATAFCAGTSVSGFCPDDYGSAFVSKNADGFWVLHGILSFGSSCDGDPNHPEVHTRIGAYRNWIESKIDLLTSVQ